MSSENLFLINCFSTILIVIGGLMITKSLVCMFIYKTEKKNKRIDK